jgi:hypothetical protein
MYREYLVVPKSPILEDSVMIKDFMYGLVNNLSNIIPPKISSTEIYVEMSIKREYSAAIDNLYVINTYYFLGVNALDKESPDYTTAFHVTMEQIESHDNWTVSAYMRQTLDVLMNIIHYCKTGNRIDNAYQKFVLCLDEE